MPRPSSPRLSPIALALVVLLALLVSHNIVLAVRNQLVFDKWHRTQKQLPRLAEISAASKNVNTRNRFSVFYLLRDRIGGAAVVLPPEFEPLTWWLGHASMLDLTPGTARIVGAPQFAELKQRAELSRIVRVHPDQKRSERVVHFIFRGAGERYVCARPADSSGDWILAPGDMVDDGSSK